MIDEPAIQASEFAAVILTGGTGARLGGMAKHELSHGGRSLLDHALAAVAGAGEVVVVGPGATVRPAPTSPSMSGSARTQRLTFVVEDPPRGGPAAGLLAGVRALSGSGQMDSDQSESGQSESGQFDSGQSGSGQSGSRALLAVLAVDMPFVTATTIVRLRAALADDPAADGAFLVDGDGRRQLAGVLWADRLVHPAHPETAANLPMHKLLGELRLLRVAAIGPESTDIDTPADLAALQTDDAATGLAPGQSDRQATEMDDWIEQLRSALDTDGDPNAEVDQELILDLARIAAHSVERKSAPITTYLLGYAAGAAGADAKQIAALAFKAQRLAEQWNPAHPAGSKEG